MYPIIALVGLTVFTWIVAIWATLESEGEEHRDRENEEENSSRGQDHRMAA